MSEPVIPERWKIASASGYIELSQESYAALGARIDAAEAKVAAAEAKVAELERSKYAALAMAAYYEGDSKAAEAKVAEQAATIGRLTGALNLFLKYAPLSGDMALMIRASQPGGEEAHRHANRLIEHFEHLNEAHDQAVAALLAEYREARKEIS